MHPTIAGELIGAACLDLGEDAILTLPQGTFRLRGHFSRKAVMVDSGDGLEVATSLPTLTVPELPGLVIDAMHWGDDSMYRFQPDSQWKVQLCEREKPLDHWRVQNVQTDGEAGWKLTLTREGLRNGNRC